ncbi:unnamed protein product, partial [Discosporangium mesarthrocarpum]
DRKAGKIKVTQTAYIDQICERFAVTTNSPIPATTSLKLLPLQDDEEECEEKFEALTGVLLWVANMTRPEISISVRALTKHMQAASKKHWKAGLKVLKFLKKTRDWGPTFQKTGTMQLCAYEDSSYAGDEGDRRSVSGGAVMFAGAAIAWFSRTQKVVPLSSTEAEYMALGECAKELLFLSNVLRFIH